jgi:hypothetical protein
VKWAGVLVAVLALTACSQDGSGVQIKVDLPPPVQTAAPSARVLTSYGLGKVRIGMSEADAVEALGGVRTEEAQSHDSDCHMLFPKAGPKNFYVMTEGHKVVRISLWDDVKTIKTDKGLGVGATEAQVRAAYGSALEVTAADYDPAPALNLVAWTVKGKAGIRYETDKTRHVRAIHAGGPAILYAEDCE